MLFCGIDIGTTNTKAVFADENFNLIDKVNMPLSRDCLASRIDASVWLDQFYEPIRYFLKNNPLGKEKLICGISVQGGSFVCLDSNNRPIDKGFSWTGLADERYVDELTELIAKEEFYKRVGWQPASWLMAIKLKQWLDEDKRNREELRRIAQIPEWIFANADKEFIADYTNTQISGLFDFTACEYIDEILDWLGVSTDMLPRVTSSENIRIDGITIDGIECNIAGSMHDQYAVMIGCGFENISDELALSAGTAWVIDGVADKPVYDFDDFLIAPGRFVRDNGYGYITSLGEIGGKFHKLIEQAGISFSDINDKLEEYPAIKEFMMSAADELRKRIEKISRLQKREIGKIIIMGGAAKNRQWLEIIADVCNLTLEVIDFSELAAYGAMRLAYYISVGKFPDNDLFKQMKMSVITPERGR